MREPSFGIIVPVHSSVFRESESYYKWYLRHLKSIEAIDYSNFKVFVVSTSKPSSNIQSRNSIFIKSAEDSKIQQLEAARKYFGREGSVPDYLVRLDPFDLISPTIFQEFLQKEKEVFYDKFHWFFNLENMEVFSFELDFIPNSCIMNSTFARKKVYLENQLFFNVKHLDWKYSIKSEKTMMNEGTPLFIKGIEQRKSKDPFQIEEVFLNKLSFKHSIKQIPPIYKFLFNG